MMVALVVLAKIPKIRMCSLKRVGHYSAKISSDGKQRMLQSMLQVAKVKGV